MMCLVFVLVLGEGLLSSDPGGWSTPQSDAGRYTWFWRCGRQLKLVGDM